MHKVFTWWQAAADGITGFTHFAKVDDDSFLHVPNLLQALSAQQAPYLVLGGMAFAGYDPKIFRMCGWSWQAGRSAWKARRCGERGFSQPFAFPLGQLQVLSRSLVRALTASEDVAKFSILANASEDLRKRDSNEDVALGFWIATIAARAPFNVSYVAINDRATNLGCFRNGGLYQHPKANAIVVHRIKGAPGMAYVWGMLHDGKPHDPIDCARDSGIELPRNSLLFTPAIMKRVREGSVTVSYDPKTNRVRMTFQRQRQRVGNRTDAETPHKGRL